MHPDFVNAAEMLALPRTSGLAEERLKGRRCVWCGGASTVDLGPRVSTLNGGLHPWRPKSCTACARREARRTFNIHVQNCARCCRTRYCPDASALHALGWP